MSRQRGPPLCSIAPLAGLFVHFYTQVDEAVTWYNRDLCATAFVGLDYSSGDGDHTGYKTPIKGMVQDPFAMAFEDWVGKGTTPGHKATGQDAGTQDVDTCTHAGVRPVVIPNPTKLLVVECLALCLPPLCHLGS